MKNAAPQASQKASPQYRPSLPEIEASSKPALAQAITQASSRAPSRTSGARVPFMGFCSRSPFGRISSATTNAASRHGTIRQTALTFTRLMSKKPL